MWIRRLTLFAVLLACGVVALGAYTRLQDAGLGCPDWPGCYGHLVVPESHDAVHRANSAYPERPLEPEKAWAEMVHRYFASTLGLVIVVISVLCLRARKTDPQQSGIEQVAGIVAGERPSGAVGAVHAGGKPDNAQPRVRVTKGRHRRVPPVGVLRLAFAAQRDKARAERAIDRRFGRSDRALLHHRFALGHAAWSRQARITI